MNTLHLARCLGDITSPSFQRYYFQRQLESLDHDLAVLFNRQSPSVDDNDVIPGPVVAHKAGTNCVAIDQTIGRYLISGGADTAIRLWDLENPHIADFEATDINARTYHTVASISKATKSSHTHSITSLSIYPHDPTPQTLLTTSYDQSLLLTSITPTSLQPLHSFPLDFTVYTHSISPHPAQPLVAVGTSNPAPRLIDLRTALATHSLPGHNGAIYSLAWHPTREHTLISSSTDGRILAFDIRRATPAFASFWLDDSLGVTDPSNHTRKQLDYSHRAHEAPITGILFNDTGDKLISAAQDQRIRVWDVPSGKSDLVHFGPRIRNSRDGELKPVLLPRGFAGGTGATPGHEVLFWPNDDGRGEIFMCEVREGTLLKVLKTKSAVQIGNSVGSSAGLGGSPATSGPTRGRGRGVAGTNTSTSTRGGPINAKRPNPSSTRGGVINSLAFRPLLSDEGLGTSLEMYSAHGDGRICAWSVDGSAADLGDDVDNDGNDDADGDSDEDEDGKGKGKRMSEEELAAERSRKRKRELIDGLVEGLTKRPVTFS